MSPPADARARFETIADEVFEPLQRYLGRRASTDDAADVFSDVLLTIWRRIDDVPADAVLPWCYGVARRTLANHRRSRDRRLRLVRRLEAQPPPFPDPWPGAEAGDPGLDAALARLPDGDREILRLWAWEELEPREIAGVLEITPNAASLRLGRAKSKLEAELRRQDTTGTGHRGDERTEEVNGDR